MKRTLYLFLLCNSRPWYTVTMKMKRKEKEKSKKREMGEVDEEEFTEISDKRVKGSQATEATHEEWSNSVSGKYAHSLRKDWRKTI